MNYADKQGTDKNTDKPGEKKRKKKTKNGDWNTSTTNSWNIIDEARMLYQVPQWVTKKRISEFAVFANETQVLSNKVCYKISFRL